MSSYTNYISEAKRIIKLNKFPIVVEKISLKSKFNFHNAEGGLNISCFELWFYRVHFKIHYFNKCEFAVAASSIVPFAQM